MAVFIFDASEWFSMNMFKSTGLATLLLIALMTSPVLSGQALAQTPADPDSPTEQAPPAEQDTPSPEDDDAEDEEQSDEPSEGVEPVPEAAPEAPTLPEESQPEATPPATGDVPQDDFWDADGDV